MTSRTPVVVLRVPARVEPSTAPTGARIAALAVLGCLALSGALPGVIVLVVIAALLRPEAVGSIAGEIWRSVR